MQADRYSWFAHRHRDHLVAGYANSLISLNTADFDFVTIASGDCIYISAGDDLPTGIELFVYYNDD